MEFPSIVSLHIGVVFSTARGDHSSSKPADMPSPAPSPHPAMTDCSHASGFYGTLWEACTANAEGPAGTRTTQLPSHPEHRRHR